MKQHWRVVKKERNVKPKISKITLTYTQISTKGVIPPKKDKLIKLVGK